MKSLYVSSFFILAVAIALFQSCGSAESSNSIPTVGEAIPVKVFALKQKELSQPITSSGTFTTNDETTLSFKTGGVVEQVVVKEGDYVRKGQLLASLDLTEISAQVSQALLAYEKSKRDFTRAENLYKDSVATLEQLQNARTAMSMAEQQLQAARFNLGFSEIRAVSDGYVLKKFVNEGQLVWPGASIIRTNGAGNQQWIFKAALSDKEWALVQVGDSAVIRTDAHAGKLLQARVLRKAEGADPATGTFTVELEVAKEQQKGLASGLFGTATLFPSAVSKVWNIPYEALLDAHADKGFVFVTSDNKTARRIPVTLSFIDKQWAYISSGLENENTLVTSGSAYLSDNSSISVLP